MRVQTSDIISLGSLAFAVLAYMKARKKIVFWLLIVISLAALSVSIFSRSERTATPTKQSATASGGSTIIQAGGNVTIINPGVGESTERARLRGEGAKLEDELAHKYPLGYALLGVANGKIVYEPYIKQFRISGDWENWRIVISDEGNPMVTLMVSKLEIDGTRFESWTLTLPYSDGEAVHLPLRVERPAGVGAVYPYVEVVDTNQKIFAIGFSDKPLNP